MKQETRDEAIDRVIDEVARQLTDGAPDANFRAEVLERLDAPRGRRWWIWILSPIAVAAVVLIVAFVGRANRVREASIAPQTAVLRPDVSLVSPETNRATTDPGTSAQPAPASSSTSGRAIPFDFSAARPLAEPALPRLEVARINLTRIELNAIDSGPSIELEQLEPIAPLAIDPLDDPRGDRQ